MELHGRLRGGNAVAADGHGVGDDDAFAGHDVLEQRVVGDERAALEAEAAALEATDAEVGLEGLHLPALTLDDPAALLHRVLEGLEHASRRRVVAALDGDRKSTRLNSSH